MIDYSFIADMIDFSELKILVQSGEAITYSQMCQRLKLPQKTGMSKVSQMRALESICKIKKMTGPTRYVFEEIHMAYLPKLNDKRNKYVNYIEAILCAILETGVPVIVSNIDLILMCRMANENFKIAKAKEHRAKIAVGRKVNDSDIAFFTQAVEEHILLPIIRSALVNLEKKKVVKIAPAYKYKKINRKGFQILPATFGSKLFNEFHEIEYEARKELNMTNMTYVPHEFYSAYQHLCNIKVQEKFPDIEFFYSCREIVTQKAIIKDALPRAYAELNAAVGKRVMTIEALDDLTQKVRKMLTEDMINLDPSVDYEKILKSFDN